MLTTAGTEGINVRLARGQLHAWSGRWIERKLPVGGKKLFNHGVVWCTETPHHGSDELKPARPITDDNVQATELDSAALSHLRSAAGDFTKVFGFQCLL